MLGLTLHRLLNRQFCYTLPFAYLDPSPMQHVWRTWLDMLQSWKIQVVEMGQFACEGSGIDPFPTDFARTHALLVALGGLIKHIVVPK